MDGYLTHHQGGLKGDIIALVTIVLPHIVAVVVALLNWKRSRNNGVRLRRIERALNGKVDYPGELVSKVDNSRK